MSVLVHTQKCAHTLSASGSTVAWFLAPKLACTRLPLAVARAKMWAPAAFPPTKEMAYLIIWWEL